VYILARGDSMQPTLRDGSYYCVEPIENGRVEVNDIIVFKKNDIIICHRVVRILRTKDGHIFFETKGDNCHKSDNFAITLDMIIGKVLKCDD
jgi:signal peptidase I